MRLPGLWEKNGKTFSYFVEGLPLHGTKRSSLGGGRCCLASKSSLEKGSFLGTIPRLPAPRNVLEMVTVLPN